MRKKEDNRVIPRFLAWVSGSRSFTERDSRKRRGFAEKYGEPGLGYIELEMPRYHKMEQSRVGYV